MEFFLDKYLNYLDIFSGYPVIKINFIWYAKIIPNLIISNPNSLQSIVLNTSYLIQLFEKCILIFGDLDNYIHDLNTI